MITVAKALLDHNPHPTRDRLSKRFRATYAAAQVMCRLLTPLTKWRTPNRVRNWRDARGSYCHRWRRTGGLDDGRSVKNAGARTRLVWISMHTSAIRGRSVMTASICTRSRVFRVGALGYGRAQYPKYVVQRPVCATICRTMPNILVCGLHWGPSAQVWNGDEGPTPTYIVETRRRDVSVPRGGNRRRTI